MFTRDFWKDAGVRALRTVAQTALATIGAATVFADVNWTYVFSASTLAGVVSLLMSLDRLAGNVTDNKRDAVK